MADSDDELYYLQPDFNLNSLTIPKLRGILVQHDVAWSSSAKKAELVDLIQTEILPKAKKLLRERDRVRRTSRGITDLSSQESTVGGEDEDDRELMPPPPAPKTPRSRKSKSNLAEPTTATSSRSKTPSKRKSSSRARASETETDGEAVRSTARKTRKSTPGPTPVLAPAVKLEEPRRIKREDGGTPFSDENPFQQGSSPPSASSRKSSSRRKSAGRPGSSRRRETTSPTIKHEDDGHTSYQFPIEQLRSRDYIPATEEFTPDAAQEVAVEDQLVPRRTQALVRRKKKQQSSPVAKNASLAALTAVLAALAAWYRQEKVNVGYCGVGAPEWSLTSNPNIPPWVHENLGPNCEPCPQHAICFPNMEVQCEKDFVLSQHPLSLGGLVPVAPTCEPDSEKERRIKAVADKAIEELRERRAAYECGEELAPEESSSVVEEVKTVVKAGETKLEISEEALKARVSAQRRRDMSPSEFEALFEGALDDVKGREEVEVVRDGTRNYLRSTSLANLPLTCAVRRYAVRTVAAYRIPLAFLMLVVAGIAYVRSRILAYQAATAQIPGLVATTLDRLATQAALKEDGRAKEAHLSVGGLRDDVLRNVFSAHERERVWTNVRKIVEGNSNVRAATREGRGGEVGRVWEWIGPVDFAGVAGLDGRRSGVGYSLGGESRFSLESPAAGSGTQTPVEAGNAPGAQDGPRSWNEGRTYF